MQVTLVSVDVTPGDEEDFASESIANALASVEEPENCRFDVLRAVEDPSKFLLVEIYATAAGPVAHKETDHYDDDSTGSVWTAGFSGMAMEFEGHFSGDEFHNVTAFKFCRPS